MVLNFLRKRFFNNLQIMFHVLFVFFTVIAIINTFFTELMKKVVPMFCFFVFGIQH